MDKIFAIVDSASYVEVDGRWRKCAITAHGVEVLDAADVQPVEKYSLREARAKLSGAQIDPLKRGRKADAQK